jgi:hypothetical protein
MICRTIEMLLAKKERKKEKKERRETLSIDKVRSKFRKRPPERC